MKPEREKQLVAAASVVVAMLLTVFKLIVGVATGSLGILAEAAHSGLDLVAAFVTFLAVSFSSRPPDRRHHYGHGKIENLSALFETLLLLVTCVWIIYEGVQRLFVKTVEIEPSVWAFGVMIVSLAALIWISRLLYAAARKHRSQALEADALHFKTDIWSTIVVILGLTLVLVGDVTGQRELLGKADAVAALVVAAIVVKVSLDLGKRTVEALIDTAPPGVAALIESEVSKVAGVDHVDAVRVRRSGPETFADITVSVAKSAPLAEAHAVATAVEEAARAVAPDSSVMVHTDPDDRVMDTMQQVRLTARRMHLDVHNLSVHRVGGRAHLTLDLEVAGHLRLNEAHAVASKLEERLRQDVPSLDRIDTHIEPRPQRATRGEDVTAQSTDIAQAVDDAIAGLPSITGHHGLTVLRSNGSYNVSLHCTFAPTMSLRDVHHLSEEVGQRVRQAVPSVARVIIHPEP